MNFKHDTLAQGRWQTLSLPEQLGNIGSEVHRARMAEHGQRTRFLNACDRALELFDLTLDDPRWRGRLREIARAQEVFCDTVLGGEEYGDSLESLEKYFDPFALLARKTA